MEESLTKAQQAATEQLAEWQAAVEEHKNAFTSSPMFKNMCKTAFETVDIDKSGTVGLEEVYIAVLLFYSKLAMFAKGMIPPTIDDIRQFLKKVCELENSDKESVDLEGFSFLLTLLLEHLVARVLVQILVAFLVIPLVAARLWDLYQAVYLKDTLVGSFIPRAIGVNLSVTLLVSTLVPYALRFFESSTEERLNRFSSRKRALSKPKPKKDL